MSKPLLPAGLGDFVSVGVKGFAPRWVRTRHLGRRRPTPSARSSARRSSKKSPRQAGGKAAVEDNPHTMVYTQSLRHPRLQWAVRQLEVWKREPRARLTFRLNRISSESPEAFFVAFPLPCEGTLPADQLRRPAVHAVQRSTARHVPRLLRHRRLGPLRGAEGHWLWVSRDAPLVTFGGPQVLRGAPIRPQDMHRVLAMVFNNFWYTNFVGDSHGVMEFQFDLAWREKLDGVGRRGAGRNARRRAASAHPARLERKTRSSSAGFTSPSTKRFFTELALT